MKRKITPVIIKILWITTLVLLALIIIFDITRLWSVLLLVLMVHNLMSAVWNIVEWRLKRENKYIVYAILDIVILLNVILYVTNYVSIRALLDSRGVWKLN